jgi:hypothetical protein
MFYRSWQVIRFGDDIPCLTIISNGEKSYVPELTIFSNKTNIFTCCKFTPKKILRRAQSIIYKSFKHNMQNSLNRNKT